MIVVSACLLGTNCKYNGGNNLSDAVAKYVKSLMDSETEKILLVCPETEGGLPTPRPPAEITSFSYSGTTTRPSCSNTNKVSESSSGWTDIFIYPGFQFQVIDALITNFHLPKSTLMMLVSAFAGKKEIFHAYEIAQQEKYRFFSFGDAMFIEEEKNGHKF